ncbi:MAG: CHAT domain-containing protein [Oscillatoria sp. SIO1A7]|nr:CHAT domain-containing protein [Oscillatoria sp. SIO1A7]
MKGKRTIWQLGFKFIALGLVGVLLSLGSYLLSPDKVLATNSLDANREPPQVMAFVQKGQTNYDEGRFSEAVELYERAVREYEAGGYILNQALVLSNLSLAYRELGLGQKAENAIAKSLSLLELQSDADTTVQFKVRARVWNAKGSLLLATKEAEEALNAWREAETSYRQAGDPLGALGCQINQAQALQVLGLYRKAENLLNEIQQYLKDISEDIPEKYRFIEIAALHNIGNLLRQKGYFQEARETLQESLELAKRFYLRHEAGKILISLGNMERAQRSKLMLSAYRARQQQKYAEAESWEEKAKEPTKAALDFYKRAAKQKNLSPQTFLEARLNYLSLLVETIGEGRKNAENRQAENREAQNREREAQNTEAENLWRSVRNELKYLPPGRNAVYARVNLAKTLVCLREKKAHCLRQEERSDSLLSAKTLKRSSFRDAIALFEQASAQALKLQDDRALSYALGNLGRLYEEMGDWQNAKRYTQQALSLANIIQGRDIAYQWQWQFGRLLSREKNMEGAMSAYSQAIQDLDTLRGDLANLNRDRQLDFRDEVEPVYRRTLDLLLQPEPGESQPSQKNLKEARDVFESLQVAELDDFFLDGCSPVRSNDIDDILDNYDPSAAVIHAILLEDRLAVILRLPKDKHLYYYESRQKKHKVQETLNKLKQYFFTGNPGYTPDIKEETQKLYKWLSLQYIEQKLQQKQNYETLAFVLDRPLQNIPIAVLSDDLENDKEEKYFLEKDYIVALAPAIKLLNTQVPVETEIFQESKVFTGGVGEAQNIGGIPFQAIEKLREELEGIGKFFLTDSPLLNQEFTKNNIEVKLGAENFPIVHIKTHGQFSSDPEETYIVAYRDLIRSRELDGLVKSGGQGQVSTIELLVLSACETAQGDDRASLGLAGVAVRAGARSTLSTLWIAQDDPTTQLMLKFYEELSKPNMTKARALHNAQIWVLNQYKIPYFWAPYILVGNWL